MQVQELLGALVAVHVAPPSADRWIRPSPRALVVVGNDAATTLVPSAEQTMEDQELLSVPVSVQVEPESLDT